MSTRLQCCFLAALIVAAAHAAVGQDVPGDSYGIRVQYANPAELATTNLAPGEVVVNERDWTDLRIGDGATPGGVHVGAGRLEEALSVSRLHEWGGATAAETRAMLAFSVADQRGAVRNVLAAMSNRLDEALARIAVLEAAIGQ